MLSICKFNHLVLESTSMVCYRSLYYVPLWLDICYPSLVSSVIRIQCCYQLQFVKSLFYRFSKMINPWTQHKYLTWFPLSENFDLLIRQELIVCPSFDGWDPCALLPLGWILKWEFLSLFWALLRFPASWKLLIGLPTFIFSLDFALNEKFCSFCVICLLVGHSVSYDESHSTLSSFSPTFSLMSQDSNVSTSAVMVDQVHSSPSSAAGTCISERFSSYSESSLPLPRLLTSKLYQSVWNNIWNTHSS